MKMYCITMQNEHYEKIKKFGYIPVGLGKNIIQQNFQTDNVGKNISHKNPFYGEYSFHYWIWKNEINNLRGEKWIGFCQYRKFWFDNNKKNFIENLEELDKVLIKKIPENYDKFESILGEPLYVNQLKLSKFIKKNIVKFIKKPVLLFDRSKRTIKFHFDLMHGDGNLDKAISLLNKEDKKDFYDFVNSEVSFNPHNMFICKSSKILNDYYDTIFPWLERCEKEFGFDLEGYGLKRIYGFLAERFMSYWFKKYTNYKTLPILFKDISDLN